MEKVVTMENLTIIACIGKNNELGKDNQLIWRFKEDMSFFKEQTMGKEIVMGTKTLQSLPHLLPGRTHLLISKHQTMIPGVQIFRTVDDFLNYAYQVDNEIMVIGGASIYKELLPYTAQMYLTEVDRESEADAFFPEFDKEEWNQELLTENVEKGIPYKRIKYLRKDEY